MDTKNTVALTVGLGALGTLLAYYGYNNLNNDPLKEEDSEFIKESQVATTEEQRKQALTRPKSPVKETIENNVKLAIAEIRAEKEKVKAEKVKEDEAASADSGEKVLSEKKEMKDKDKWKQYWKNEYTSTQPNAADYN